VIPYIHMGVSRTIYIEPQAVMAMVNSSIAYALGENEKAEKSLQAALKKGVGEISPPGRWLRKISGKAMVNKLFERRACPQINP